MIEYWLAFPFAVLVSTFAMMTGGEGAILFVPFFLLLGIEPGAAISTAFVTQLFGKGSGALGYVRSGLIQWNALALLVAAGVPLVVIGSYTSISIGSQPLRLLFGLGAIAIACAMLYSLVRKREGAREKLANRELAPWALVPAVAGFITGLIAIGVGTINTAFLERVLGLRMHKAVATATAAMAFTALAGALVHASLGSVSWAVAVFTIPAVVIGAQAGSRLAPKIAAWKIKLLFAALTLVVGAYMCAAGV